MNESGDVRQQPQEQPGPDTVIPGILRITYRVLGQEMFPTGTGQVSAVEVSAAGDGGGAWHLTVSEETGGTRLLVQGDAALAAAPAVASALTRARSLPDLLTELTAAGAADQTRRPAALVVTMDDVAAWCRVTPSTARAWPGIPGFPGPLPPAAGEPTWWWPGIRDFIAANTAALAADIPLLTAHIPSPPPGRRGPKPRSWVRTELDMQLIRVLHARCDAHGRPVLTRAQIAASLLHPLPPAVISRYLPRGRGGDPRTLPDAEIARMRELRGRGDGNGRHLYSLEDLAGMFDVSDMTVSRYCRDIQLTPPTPRPQDHDHHHQRADPDPRAGSAGTGDVGAAQSRRFPHAHPRRGSAAFRDHPAGRDRDLPPAPSSPEPGSAAATGPGRGQPGTPHGHPRRARFRDGRPPLSALTRSPFLQRTRLLGPGKRPGGRACGPMCPERTAPPHRPVEGGGERAGPPIYIANPGKFGQRARRYAPGGRSCRNDSSPAVPAYERTPRTVKGRSPAMTPSEASPGPPAGLGRQRIPAALAGSSCQIRLPPVPGTGCNHSGSSTVPSVGSSRARWWNQGIPRTFLPAPRSTCTSRQTPGGPDSGPGTLLRCRTTMWFNLGSTRFSPPVSTSVTRRAITRGTSGLVIR